MSTNVNPFVQSGLDIIIEHGAADMPEHQLIKAPEGAPADAVAVESSMRSTGSAPPGEGLS
jgi:hypothetical protein